MLNRARFRTLAPLLYRKSTPADLQVARRLLRCLFNSVTMEQASAAQDLFKTIDEVFSAFLPEIESRIRTSRTRDQEVIANIKKEVEKLIDFARRSKQLRVLPFRGQNTIQTRGAVRMESRETVQERILPRLLVAFPYKPIVFMSTYVSHLKQIDDELRLEFTYLDLWRELKNAVILFDVLTRDRDHVFRGILFPRIGRRFPRRLVYINTWWLDDATLHALRDSMSTLIEGLQLTDLESVGIIRTTILPNDLEMSPELRAKVIEINPALESQIERLQELQSLDESCRGVGQCQHWSFMTAYVFLKEYAELLRNNLSGEEEFKSMCFRVWRRLEQAEPTPGFNALQREMHLLGGLQDK